MGSGLLVRVDARVGRMTAHPVCRQDIVALGARYRSPSAQGRDMGMFPLFVQRLKRATHPVKVASIQGGVVPRCNKNRSIGRK
jgi:hypothetical protein